MQVLIFLLGLLSNKFYCVSEVSKIVDNILFLKIIFNAGKCRRLV